MAQISYDTIGGLAVQRLIQRQGVSSRSRAVQNKFVKKWAAWILMGTVVALFYVWSRVKVVEFGYELTAMQRNAGELAKQVSTLEAEVAGLKSPRRLEEAAGRMGLSPPKGKQVVLVEP